jgi:hypothetical protein
MWHGSFNLALRRFAPLCSHACSRCVFPCRDLQRPRELAFDHAFTHSIKRGIVSIVFNSHTLRKKFTGPTLFDAGACCTTLCLVVD